MIENEITRLSRVLSAVSMQENGRQILLSVKYNQISKMNLILLKALLSEQKKRGLFVTVDRPHQYMAYLLEINRVPQEELTYLDVISRYSGEKGSIGDGDDEEHLSPFNIHDLLFILENGGANRDPRASQIDLGILDFVMIDNLSAMLLYNDLSDVAVFIQRYIKLVQRYGRIFTALVLDVRSQPHLYQTIQGLCQKEFIVTDDGDLQPLDHSVVEASSSAKDNPVVESAIIFAPNDRSKERLYRRPTEAV